MGWLKLGNKRNTISTSQRPLDAFQNDLKETAQHIEHVSFHSSRLEFPIVDTSVPDGQLPFIPVEKVVKQASREAGGLFIVIDNIVYDCTDFVTNHPGGEQIIKSFGGAECSWQFWRFHGLKELEESARPLRVGKTGRIVNRFKEPPKYVGLRRFGSDECN